MPDGSPNPSSRRQRRPRCNFHFKIDEMLKPEHRENYLALVRSPHMRVDDAHAWLLGQGYELSRSAVARHRRHLLLTDSADGREARRATEFARVMYGRSAGAPPAADFIAGAHVRLQQLVFDRLVDLQTPTDDDYREGRVSDDGTRVIPAKELLEFAKLVAQCLQLEHLYITQLEERDRAAEERRAAHDARAPQDASRQPRTDEEIRQRIEDIMRRRA